MMCSLVQRGGDDFELSTANSPLEGARQMSRPSVGKGSSR